MFAMIERFRLSVTMDKILRLVLVAVFCLAPALAKDEVPPADPAAANGRDVLIYKDGDKVKGHFVERVGDTIVFKSDRFGELRVLVSEAEVVMVKKAPSAVTAKKKEQVVVQEEDASPIWTRFTPWALTASVRRFFGPWHGRFAFSTELVSDTKDRNTVTVESQLQRKWARDEVQLTGRYDFSRTAGTTTTDMIKAAGSWRHDFPARYFSQYRPTVEWNQAAVSGSLPSDYVLVQQEIGAGVTALNNPDRKLRMGLSENVFDIWITETGSEAHSSRLAQSTFIEVEWKLPLRLMLTERGVWYFRSPLDGQDTGWENRLELNKKLTETLSAAMRHEVRHNNPDVRVQDYTRLKLLLGLDF
jgi:hypothetical protein